MEDGIIGMITAVPFNFVPQGWLLCDGSTVSIREYTALYATLGIRYGGDGQATFGLPDLRGYTIIGAGTSAAQGRSVPPVQIAKTVGANTLSTQLVAGASMTVATANLPATPLGGTLDISGLSATSTLNAATNGPGATAPTTGAMLSASGTGTAGAASLYFTPPASPAPTMANLGGVTTTVGGAATFTTKLGAGKALSLTGASTAVDIPQMQPSLGLMYIICYDGYFLPNPN
jgi:microcystin-dependent protein